MIKINNYNYYSELLKWDIKTENNKAKNGSVDITLITLKLMGDLDVNIWDEKIKHKIIELYTLYNSKSCVSITLVELNNFFSGNDYINFAKKFDCYQPNKILINELSKLYKILNI